MAWPAQRTCRDRHFPSPAGFWAARFLAGEIYDYEFSSTCGGPTEAGHVRQM